MTVLVRVERCDLPATDWDIGILDRLLLIFSCGFGMFISCGFGVFACGSLCVCV